MDRRSNYAGMSRFLFELKYIYIIYYKYTDVIRVNRLVLYKRICIFKTSHCRLISFHYLGESSILFKISSVKNLIGTVLGIEEHRTNEKKLDFFSPKRVHIYTYTSLLFFLFPFLPFFFFSIPRHNLPTLENRIHAIIKRVSVYVSRILSVFFIAATFICCLLISSARTATANSIPRTHVYIQGWWWW